MPSFSMYCQMMREFHKAFDVPAAPYPTILDDAAALRRLTLIFSEAGELGDAQRERNIEKIVDGLADLLYVTFGYLIEMGVNPDEAFALVHESNMSKIFPDGRVHKDAGGKVLKPDSYNPVDLSYLSKRYANRYPEVQLRFGPEDWPKENQSIKMVCDDNVVRPGYVKNLKDDGLIIVVDNKDAPGVWQIVHAGSPVKFIWYITQEVIEEK